jgi:SagB-type dehydrogenase family enzyme
MDARRFHDRTNHHLEGLREEGFRPDLDNQPRPDKQYVDVPTAPLGGIRPPQAPALATIATSRADPLADAQQPAPAGLDREALASICYEASGVLNEVEANGRTVRYRAASCTGKLYHVDCYVVVGDVDGLDAGVYHFDPASWTFDVLRTGDYRGTLAAATGDSEDAGGDASPPASAAVPETGVADAPATVVATSTWWRNAWKYRERTYRHAFWDTGTVLANLLATAHALDYRASVVAAFADDPVATLLGVDPDDEAPIALAPVGSGAPAPDPLSVDALSLAVEPYSENPGNFPVIADAWRASRLDEREVTDWRERVPASIGRRAPGDGERVPLDPVDHETASARPLANVIRRRRSCREFARRPLSRRQLATILDRATRGVPADYNDGDASGLQFNDVFLLVNDVEGVRDGSFQYHPAANELERLGENPSGTQTRLAIGQDWAGDAHVNVYLLADVDAVVDALGDRGYRLAQLEAGVVLGRLYLATYAHRDLGGTGLTFADDDVTEHFEPRADGQAPMTMFALGVAD